MTNLQQTLFRIDPTEGFIQYIQTIKPYHSKVLDVLVEYVYTDQVAARVTERWATDMLFTRPDSDIVYSCGYGYRWDPTGMTAPESVPATKILSATAQSVSSLANSFLVEAPTFSPYTIAVANLKSNQLAFVVPFTITAIDYVARAFIVSGDATTQDLSVNNHIYVANNTGAGVNGRYDVVSVVTNGTTSTITVAQPVSLLATNTGVVNFPQTFVQLPYWATGTAVVVTTTGTMPQTVVSQQEYYFIPSGTAGLFNLATQRYPDKFSDFVDLTTLGSGTISIKRAEPFVPGDTISITNSKYGRNNGQYIVKQVTKEGNNFRIFVMQRVRRTSTLDQTYDGMATLYVDTFNFPDYCALAKATDLHTETFIDELLQFTFEVALSDKITSTALENQPPDGNHTVNQPYSVPTPSTELFPAGIDAQFFDCGALT